MIQKVAQSAALDIDYFINKIYLKIFVFNIYNIVIYILFTTIQNVNNVILVIDVFKIFKNMINVQKLQKIVLSILRQVYINVYNAQKDLEYFRIKIFMIDVI